MSPHETPAYHLLLYGVQPGKGKEPLHRPAEVALNFQKL